MTDSDIPGRDDALASFAQVSSSGPGLPAMPAVSDQIGFSRSSGAIAVAVRRDLGRVLHQLKTLAAAAGSDWYYRYPVRDKGRKTHIEGPSIKLANDLARLYGNCDVDCRVEDHGNHWIILARFLDLETGYCLTRPFRQSKGASRLGGDDDDRRLDMALQIGVSKAIRNVVVNSLQTFADEAFGAAKSSLVEKIGRDLPKYRDMLVERLKERDIALARVEQVIGRAAKEWLAQDVATVRAMLQAIDDGMATRDDTFPALMHTGNRPTPEPDKKAEKPKSTAKDKPAPAKSDNAGRATPPKASDTGKSEDRAPDKPERADEANAPEEDGGEKMTGAIPDEFVAFIARLRDEDLPDCKTIDDLDGILGFFEETLTQIETTHAEAHKQVEALIDARRKELAEAK